MDLLFGTGLFCAVTLAFTGIVLWVRRPGVHGLAASSTFQSALAIAVVALWVAALGLVGRGLVAEGAMTGAHGVGALALAVLTVAALKALRPVKRLAAYDAIEARTLALVPDPAGPLGPVGRTTGVNPIAAASARKAA